MKDHDKNKELSYHQNWDINNTYVKNLGHIYFYIWPKVYKKSTIKSDKGCFFEIHVQTSQWFTVFTLRNED